MSSVAAATIQIKAILDSIDELISDPPDGKSAKEVALAIRALAKQRGVESSLDEFLAMFEA